MAERIELHEPFRDAVQQREASLMGMYIFLATEIMLFGGLIAAILVVRALHPEEFIEASRQTHVAIGAINTAVLLTSSFAVAVAVEAGRAGRRRLAALLLLGAAALGLVFLALKGLEYSEETAEGLMPIFSHPPRFPDPVAHLFMDLYLVATGLHAVHVTIGIMLLVGMAAQLWRGALVAPERAIVLENTGLYWHFVDAVWVFLFPLLYLAR
ncbi:cytochrome c oxidase subunit 3 [Xanthobacter sp. VTT E-85241]|uniref:cytochrome c oxidase subunit 3 n=1 Tax=Roseixanthobacter finlandensis TaxID=3119922 RepID=UPI00372B62D3